MKELKIQEKPYECGYFFVTAMQITGNKLQN